MRFRRRRFGRRRFKRSFRMRRRGGFGGRRGIRGGFRM